MLVLDGSRLAAEPGLSLAAAHALLRRASRDAVTEAVRVYQPAVDTMVFGRREQRLPGFASAVALARAAGFTPAVRVTGGRAVAYTPASLVVDVVRRDAQGLTRTEERFEELGRACVRALGLLGVDARVGPVPGEYCPGAHSVNARGRVKLVGTAQRVVRAASLTSALVMVGDTERVKPLLTDVYAALEQPFDAASVGSLEEERPGLDVAAARQALLTCLAADAPPEEDDDDLVHEAHGLLAQHRV